MERGPDLKAPVPLPEISTTENTRQNGNNDSDQYSDNEEGKTWVELAWEWFKLYMNNTCSRNKLKRIWSCVGVSAWHHWTAVSNWCHQFIILQQKLYLFVHILTGSSTQHWRLLSFPLLYKLFLVPSRTTWPFLLAAGPAKMFFLWPPNSLYLCFSHA